MPAVDPFGFAGGPIGPYTDAFTITLSDSADNAKITSAIYVPTAKATLTVVMQSGAVVQLGAVAAGALLPLRIKRINTSGSAGGNDITGLI